MTQRMPPLSTSEREELETSIKRDGVKYPILVDPSGVIIDGHHREAICQKFAIECPSVTLDVDDETAERLRVQLNTARRQLSAKDRRMLAIELRANGKSTRQIAEQTGVSHKTIVKDLQSGGTQVPPAPTTVTGRDGKTYSSRSTSTKRRPFDRASAEEAAAGRSALTSGASSRSESLLVLTMSVVRCMTPDKYVASLPIEQRAALTPEVVRWWEDVVKRATAVTADDVDKSTKPATRRATNATRKKASAVKRPAVKRPAPQ